MRYAIKYEAAPQVFVEVDTFEGDADGLGIFIHNIQIKAPGRYVAEQIDELPVSKPAPKRPKKSNQ